jgi:RNA polymerase sigma factor (sigma-70 family)
MTESESESRLPPSFEELIAAARRGDRTARSDALCRIYPRVQRLVHRRLQSNFRAKNPWLRPMFSTGDVVQDVFLGVLSTASQVAAGGSETDVVRYLASAVENRVLDMMRFHSAACRDARRRAPTDEVADATAALSAGRPSPWLAAATRERLSIYLEVLESFPARQQMLLRRRLEHGQPFAEIAAEIGIPSADAARKAFNEAHAKLVVRLSSRGVHPESRD